MPHFEAERAVVREQIVRRLEDYEPALYRQRREIVGWETTITGLMQDVSPIPTAGWHPYAIGTPWGGRDVTQWFRTTVTIPVDCAGKPVVLLLHPGKQGAGEALCYIDGIPAQGLDRSRTEILLTPSAEPGREYQIHVEAYASPFQHPAATHEYRFAPADMAVRDDLARSYYWDIKVAFSTLDVLPAGSQSYQQLLDLIADSVKSVDYGVIDDPVAFGASVARAQKTFRKKLERFRANPGEGKITLVGHSHIDTAWLWPLRETRRKCSRTFSTVLKYMEQYPEYRFTQSQPQLYQFVKKHYPDLYARIKERVKEGRWEVTGGGWVEQDSNITGAESLVRQYLYGNRFFRKEFGIQTSVVWIPDSFGFPITLPQIWKKAHMKAFGTTKLGWSQYNEFPYHLMRWQGLDGSEILTMMHPCYENGYNGDITPRGLKGYWDVFKQKDASEELFFTFGWGDGGGGPTTEMLENGNRLQTMVGLPETEFGTLEGSFARIAESVDWDDLPVYNDEMYLELHRGCQTTQARMKRGNRKTEIALRDAEIFASFATLFGGTYPQADLENVWHDVLTSQFHDILPGTSITEVYQDAAEVHAQAQEFAGRMQSEALSTLSEHISTEGDGTPLLVANSLGWLRCEAAAVRIPGASAEGWSISDQSGAPVASQATPDGTTLFETSDIPSIGWALYRAKPGTSKTPRSTVRARMKPTGAELENVFFRVQIGKNGALTRVYDKKAGRDVLPKGCEANKLVLYDDRPSDWEAWDIDFNINEVAFPIEDVVSMSVTETGPVRATVRVIWTTGKSSVTQDISVWRSSPRIDFVTSVEWWENHRLLKTEFPVDVLARTATYEIQYGAIERPTHWSTPICRARFEVPGHRWIDLSEGDYGVSLLNDCKYGFDTHGNTMRISLLRGAKDPDPRADEGHHEFTYSLYPHAGPWQQAETVRRAYELNAPLTARVLEPMCGVSSVPVSFVSVDSPSIVIDCVKKAEDTEALIVRLYESSGGRGSATLKFGVPLLAVSECDLMEENDIPTKVESDGISFDFKPWEIRTFKVTFANCRV
jgi:alpha-mannosidase